MEKNNRQECNVKILEFLKQAIYSYPDLRFFQLLANIGIVEYDSDTNVIKDKFYEESKDTLEKVINSVMKK